MWLKTKSLRVVLVGGGFLLGLMIGFGYWYRIAGLRMEILANLVSSGNERLITTTVKTALGHAASQLTDHQLTEDSCKQLMDIVERSGGFYVLLAIGDMEGEAVCTSDLAVAKPLPTMKDRLYYERVREATDLVVGEYAVSKTTGKQVLHFAHPIIGQTGLKKGFVVAAIDLNWFINPETMALFNQSGVEIVGSDRNGKVLFRYPSDNQQIGKNSLSASLISAILRGEKKHIIAQSYTGEYRLYAYEWSHESDNDLVVTASASLGEYWYFWFATGLLGALLVWIIVEKVFRDGRH